MSPTSTRPRTPGPRSPRTPLPRWLPLLALFLVLALGATAAQVPGDEPALADVEALRGAVELDTTLAEDARAAVQAQLDLAKLAIEDRARWETTRAEFAAQRASAPKRLETTRAELERPFRQPSLDVDEDTALADVQASLDLARSELDSRRREEEALDAEQQRRASRRSELPPQIALLREELTGLEGELGVLTLEAAEPLERRTARLVLRARIAATRAQIAASEEELKSYEELTTLLTARRRLQEKKVAESLALVAAWEAELEQRRQRETLLAQDEVARAVAAVETAEPGLRPEYQENAELAQRLYELTSRAEDLGQDRVETQLVLQRVRNAQEAAQRREEAAGLSDAVGVLLRKERGELPPVREYARRASTRRDEMAQVRLEKIHHEEELEALADQEAAVAEVLRQSDIADTEPFEPEVGRLLQRRREYLEELVLRCDGVFAALASLEQEESALVATATSFETFIHERILWIRSSEVIWAADYHSLPQAAAWLVDVENWKGVEQTLSAEMSDNPATTVLLSLLLLAAFAARRRMRGVLARTGEEARRGSCRTMQPTWKALGATVVLAVGYPGLLWVLGSPLVHSLSGTEFAKALGSALQRASLLVLFVETLRSLQLPNGLGEAHFAWSESFGKRSRALLLLLLSLGVPLLTLAMILEGQGEDAWKYSMGRLALVGSLVTFAFVILSGVRDHRETAGVSEWAGRVRGVLRVVAWLVPGTLILLALGSYYFTAVQLVDRLLLTTGLTLFTILVHALAVRGLVLARRRLAMEQLRKLRAAQGTPEGEADPEVEARVDLAVVDAQTRQMLAVGVTVLLGAGAFWIWQDVLPALNVLGEVSLWDYTSTLPASEGGGIERISITLGNLLLSLAILGGVLLANRNLPSVLEVSLLQRLPMGPGERYAVKAVLRYVLTLIGLLWAFAEIGVGWSKLQWLVAGVSVGLGFGLQEIFANFVSGLIILGERPVRVGDWVTVGEVTGKVTRIRMRATTLVDRDLREWLIPNKEFITGRLSNWTLSDSTTRVVVPVGVAYGSDTELASRILIEVAKQNEDVRTAPPPTVVFMSFGDNSLNLELRFFIEGRDQYPSILNPINTEIHKRLAEAGVEIAFPQRDLHIRSAPGLEELLRERRS